MSADDMERLADYRLNQARSVLRDAEQLIRGEGSPESIINRSYYAMFYAVLALLQRIGRAPKKHAGALSLFDSEFVLKGLLPKELSRDLHRVFDLRQKYDYRVTAAASPAEARNVWEKARRFVNAVADYVERDRQQQGEH